MTTQDNKVRYQDVHRLALALSPEERRQLADELAHSPSGLSADTILSTISAHAEHLHGLGVKRIGLFGSHVRGEARLESDIDLLVEMAAEEYSLFDLLRVGVYLEKVFGRKVEVGTLDMLRPEIRPHVLAEVRYAEEL